MHSKRAPTLNKLQPNPEEEHEQEEEDSSTLRALVVSTRPLALALKKISKSDLPYCMTSGRVRGTECAAGAGLRGRVKGQGAVETNRSGMDEAEQLQVSVALL